MLGLRYAKAANEAGHSWRCGGLGRVRWFTANIFKTKTLKLVKATAKTVWPVVDSAQLPSGLGGKPAKTTSCFNAAPPVLSVSS